MLRYFGPPEKYWITPSECENDPEQYQTRNRTDGKRCSVFPLTKLSTERVREMKLFTFYYMLKWSATMFCSLWMKKKKKKEED